ncbi:MAG TPA: NUDIX hydrolase [Polyangia bacterium]|nr:NUDIX hydrolase [Polyangia bacterium]
MSGRPTTPLLTVDVIVPMAGGVVLIERKHPPHGWALPGGFVDPGESLAHAARREAREEISLDVELTEQFFAYSDPARDPRGPTVSVVFVGRVPAAAEPRAADDAKAVRVHPLDALPELAFDHAQILADYKRWLATGRRPEATR